MDALVAGYEPLIDAMVLPDPDDRHVLAAAVVCKASCIVTFNVSDFPLARLAPYGLHAVHPDDFLLDVESIDPAAFADAVREDLDHYRAPPLELPEYVVALRMAGVPRIADQIGKLAPILERRPSDRSADEAAGRAALPSAIPMRMASSSPAAAQPVAPSSRAAVSAPAVSRVRPVMGPTRCVGPVQAVPAA